MSEDLSTKFLMHNYFLFINKQLKFIEYEVWLTFWFTKLEEADVTLHIREWSLSLYAKDTAV